MKVVRNILAVIGGLWVAGKIWDVVDEVRYQNMRELRDEDLDQVSGGFDASKEDRRRGSI